MMMIARERARANRRHGRMVYRIEETSGRVGNAEKIYNQNKVLDNKNQVLGNQNNTLEMIIQKEFLP